MIYIAVLFGSLLGICLILGVRIALRTRGVRRFVRGIRQRADDSQLQNVSETQETRVERARKDPRASAIQLQKLRTFVRQAEKAEAQRDYERAEGLFIQALTINPAAYDVQAQLAKLYLSTGRETKSEAMYRELLQKEDDVSFHANLGLACYRQGKFAEACESYKCALERDRKNPERFAAVGRACIAAGQFQDAVGALEHACERLSRDTELLQLLAECYEALSRNMEAEETYRRINKLEPYNEAVKSKLSALAQV